MMVREEGVTIKGQKREVFVVRGQIDALMW
jgi:hypothetical protein